VNTEDKRNNEKKGYYDGFTLKKENEIEGLTMHRDHTRTCLLSALIRSYARRRGSFKSLMQGCYS
jgi:hypothetical protein